MTECEYTNKELLGIDWQLSHETSVLKLEPSWKAKLLARRAEIINQEKTMNAQAPPTTQPDIATRIAQFVKLRDKIKEIEERHEAELKPYKDAKVALEAVMLQHLNAAGADNISAKGIGTVYKSSRSSASIADGDAFRRFVIGGEHWDLLDWKANATAVETFLNEEQALPPGVNFSTKTTIGVRRS